MNFLKWLLIPFSFLYGLGIFLRNLGYDRGLLSTHKVGKPVISVGNLSTGGTGKTPVAEYLLRYFSENGFRPAYLSRGYGRKTRGYLPVSAASGDVTQFGDEALQVAMKFPDLPVAVCEDRVTGARELIRTENPDVIILDDAFQHRRIFRDLNIVVCDMNRLPWNDFLLPAGRLREPLSSLRRADFVIFNKYREGLELQKKQLGRISIPFGITRLAPGELVSFQHPGPVAPPDANTGIAGFSGLGNNKDFQKTLKELGFGLLSFQEYGDHHFYRKEEILNFLAKIKTHNQKTANFTRIRVITTEKDFSRLRNQPWLKNMDTSNFYYLPVRLKWVEGEDILAQLIQKKIENNH